MEPEHSRKSDVLHRPVRHVDITSFDSTPIIEAYGDMAFQARNLAKAADLLDRMISDIDCSVILCLSGSLFSAGLKHVVLEMIRRNMVDAIVSTGANIVDQDFFEALGNSHYHGSTTLDDGKLRELMIDRIYDTYIDEEKLRECDMIISEIADSLEPRPYSSQEFIHEIGRYLVDHDLGDDSVIRECFMRDIPIFVPAFSDCSAGFGLVHHQFNRSGSPSVSIDSAKDFLDLTRLKILSKDTGLLMIGGGVPKNFAQDITVAAEIIGKDVPMHKYAIQITVADERDGGLSGSTLSEAESWGKVDGNYSQMIFAEATLVFPLLASYVYHKGSWKDRKGKELAAKIGM